MENTSLRKNLRLLCWLRCIAIAGQIAAVLLAIYALGMTLAARPLWLIIGGLSLFNAATGVRLRHPAPVAPSELAAQLLIDSVALFGLLYFSGGAANPFASLFILQVIIAAIILPPRQAWGITLLAIGFYTLLLFCNIEVVDFRHHHAQDSFSIHIQGMWASFVLLALIVAWFVARMNATLRRQDALLAEAEKIAAIGALAANAAHELGTPLATLAILAESAGDRATALQEQLARCKRILSRITAHGGVARADSGAPMALDNFLKQLATRWRETNPQVELAVDVPSRSAPLIVAEAGLEQAVAHLLDNAAHASPQGIGLKAEWTAQWLTIVIEDKGMGIAQAVLDSPGQPGLTTRPGGMGMGLFLARSISARLEGNLKLENRPEGGARATLTLPLKRLAL